VDELDFDEVSSEESSSFNPASPMPGETIGRMNIVWGPDRISFLVLQRATDVARVLLRGETCRTAAVPEQKVMFGYV